MQDRRQLQTEQIVDSTYIELIQQEIKIDMLYKQLASTLKEIITETCKQMTIVPSNTTKPKVNGIQQHDPSYATADFGQKDMQMKVDITRNRQNNELDAVKQYVVSTQPEIEVNEPKPEFEIGVDDIRIIEEKPIEDEKIEDETVGLIGTQSEDSFTF